MWSSDLGWVPKSILQEARDEEVTQLQGFDTVAEVPQTEAETRHCPRFVDKWEETGELRSRLCARDYEASQGDPVSLFAATPSVTATRIPLVLGLAQDVDMAVADISEVFLQRCAGQVVLRQAASRVPKAKNCLEGKELSVWGQACTEEMARPLPGNDAEVCFVKKVGHAKGLDHCGCACGRSLECREARESRQLLRAVSRDVEAQACRVRRDWQVSTLPGDHISKCKDTMTLKSKDAYVDNMLAILSMEGCKPTDMPMVRKESAANGDEELLERLESDARKTCEKPRCGVLGVVRGHVLCVFCVCLCV